jgi:predicted lipoprotein with Yx(FWY)xxD motif
VTAAACSSPSSGSAGYGAPSSAPASPGAAGSDAALKTANVNGVIVFTYNGHPLYTYTADTAPGQAKGNGINIDGGVWHEVTASGQAAPADGSGGGGNGY